MVTDGLMIIGKVAEVIAKAINTIYSERSVKRKVRYNEGKPYIKLIMSQIAALLLILGKYSASLAQRMRWQN